MEPVQCPALEFYAARVGDFRVAFLRYTGSLCTVHLETPEEYRTRLKGVVAEINHDDRVENLCRELPARVVQLRVAEGGRLPK